MRETILQMKIIFVPLLIESKLPVAVCSIPYMNLFSALGNECGASPELFPVTLHLQSTQIVMVKNFQLGIMEQDVVFLLMSRWLKPRLNGHIG